MADAMRYILALSLVFGLPLTVVLIVLITIWCDAKCPNDVKLKFSSFKKFYELNPSRWVLYGTGVLCCNDEGGTISTYFGFIDFYRYLLWWKRLDKRKEDKEQAKSLASIVAVVKKDIENAELHAQFKYGQAAKIIMKVGENHE